jgi:hypothetical protein
MKYLLYFNVMIHQQPMTNMLELDVDLVATAVRLCPLGPTSFFHDSDTMQEKDMEVHLLVDWGVLGLGRIAHTSSWVEKVPSFKN